MWNKTLAASLVAVMVVAVGTSTARAATYRQSYSSWSYHSTKHYYYSQYSYRTSTTITTYRHHYCIYVPSKPRYVYYYNPTKQVYWGRFDLEEKGYSLLEPKDRKKELESIPESAFPKPGKMPVIPEAEDGVRMDPPDPKKIPEVDEPKDTP